jgi:serine/threonine protein kinase
MSPSAIVHQLTDSSASAESLPPGFELPDRPISWAADIIRRCLRRDPQKRPGMTTLVELIIAAQPASQRHWPFGEAVGTEA